MRMLHTMIRVGDLEKSILFYTHVMSMRLLRKKDYPHGKFTLAFLGYQDESKEAALELTYNWDVSHYEHGEGYGHIAIGVADIYAMCQEVEQKGGRVVREPGPITGSSSHIAFIEDPDGYKIELIQKDQDLAVS